jgi:energy-coupling factor transporter ATP-binding protein EcfA2
LIDAIMKVYDQAKLESEDVCRYSEECDIGRMGTAKIGLIFEDVSLKVLELTSEFAGKAHESDHGTGGSEGSGVKPFAERLESIAIIRDSSEEVKLLLYHKKDAEPTRLTISSGEFGRLRNELPKVIRVTPRVFLPSSVRLSELLKVALEEKDEKEVKSFLGTSVGKQLFGDRSKYDSASISESGRLVFRLMKYCANIDKEGLCRIATAPEQLLKEFSAQTSEKAEELLNLSHWWGQDVDAKISIDLRKDEVVLNLTDRTKSWYGFAERSQGMRYFLGYLVQILIELKTYAQPVIILSDEPDFALSAVGQRDILRFFNKITQTRREEGPVQLIYTTHSAELVDPNYPDRVTVLRKGLFDEGTIVINRSYHHLFEPVRSALGTRVSSLPFIDGPNLVVEGVSDQTFVRRMSQYLARRGLPHLDMAYLSLVVAEGTKRISRIVSMSRAMAGDKAYLTILLDNDDAGRAARETAELLDPQLKDNHQVVMLDEILGLGLGKDVEMEDLIPATIYFTALKNDLTENGFKEIVGKLPSMDEFVERSKRSPIVGVVEEIVYRAENGRLGFLLDKQELIERVFDLCEKGAVNEPDKKIFEKNMEKTTSILLEKVNDNLRCRRHEEIRRTIQYVVKEFLLHNPIGVSKSRAKDVLERIRELGTKVSPEGLFDREIDSVLGNFGIRSGVRSDLVDNYGRLKQELKQLHQKLTIDPNLKLM